MNKILQKWDEVPEGVNKDLIRLALMPLVLIYCLCGMTYWGALCALESVYCKVTGAKPYGKV